MIERDFRRFISPKAVGSSARHSNFVVESLARTTGTPTPSVPGSDRGQLLVNSMMSFSLACPHPATPAL